ncbi:hypothetical protein [Nocardioides sp.]|uniref:hypothetical protein n=1 Tax=Nocardioides sp. TaxID=35761 RepID=UPI003784382F
MPDDYVVVDRLAGWSLGAEMILGPGEHLHLRPLSRAAAREALARVVTGPETRQ